MKKIKVTTFTDESGQDVSSKIFVVCTAICESSDVEFLNKELLDIENKSGKTKKWYKSSNKTRASYVKKILQSKVLSKTKIYYSEYGDKTEYSRLVGSHIAKSIINYVADSDYKAKIFIDKTNKPVLEQIKKEIKAFRVHYQKIRGLSDGSSSLIRLADSLCGIVRDLSKNRKSESFRKLLKRFKEI
jgi:hypothetical protein